MSRTTGRPKAGYRNAAGEAVPGCTTITGRFKESGALIYWAWNCGKEGKDIRAEKEAAADAGSCCHEMIDCHLHNRTFQTADWPAVAIGKAAHAFLAYLEWVEQNKLTVEAAEISLVSESYQFGGTFDAVMRGGHLRLLDYKTSNGLYSDMLIQVAGGYSILWAEHFKGQPLQGIDLLRISKPKADDDPIMFEHRHWSAEIFPIAQELFLHYRRAYDLDKRLKGLM
jgi:hypothetical protein